MWVVAWLPSQPKTSTCVLIKVFMFGTNAHVVLTDKKEDMRPELMALVIPTPVRNSPYLCLSSGHLILMLSSFVSMAD